MKNPTRSLALAAIFLPLFAQAQDRTWVGTTGAWNVPANWSGSGVPVSTGFAYIDNSGTATLGVGVSGTAQNLEIGWVGTGNLLINGGYLLATDDSSLGRFAGSVGLATISSGTWENVHNLLVGYNAQGTLTISGGLVTNVYGDLGFGALGSGTALVSGGTWRNTVDLFVGESGTGTLTISGGLVENEVAEIGSNAGSNGIATVTGGTWSNLEDLFIGNSGTGTLTVSGGLVSVTGTTRVAGAGGSVGALTLSGGVLATRQLVEGSGTGTLTFNSGTLRATASQSGFISGFETGDVVINSGGAFIDSNGFSLSSTAAFTGSGALTKLGGGTLTLTGSSSQAAGTTVRSGNLTLAGILNHSSGTMIVGQLSGDSAAFIVNGGSVSSGEAFLGANSGATGVATVVNGTWSNTGNFNIGGTGTGTLNVNAGALATGSQGWIASGTGSTGTVSVVGGTWSLSNGLIVGYRGTGVLNISNGRVSSANNLAVGNNANASGTMNISAGGFLDHSANAYIGTDAGARGIVNVNGGTWNNSGFIFVGRSGTGVLNVTSGSVSSAGFQIGSLAGSSGTATVTGGVWTNSGASNIGASGSGHLVVDGGWVSNTQTFIGTGSASVGSVTVTSGSLTSTQSMQIGQSGTGSLLVNGGYVSNTSSWVGDNTTGLGSATVTSGTWSLSSGLTLGRNGTGSLLVDGGLVSSNGGTIGDVAGGRGSATVTSGTWLSSSLVVGNSGSGSLLVNGGLVRSSGVFMGSGTAGLGSATVTSGTWETGSINVGFSGSGNLLISGGVVSDSSTTIGSLAGAFGTATITGGIWTNTNTLSVGGVGTGNLLIDGGYVSAQTGQIGTFGTGSATVTSGTWVNNFMTVAGTGTGNLLINGGYVSSGGVTVGLSNGGLGTATVSSGTWANTGLLTLGASGSGNLLISGGLVSSSGVRLGDLASGVGSVTLSGGVLQTGQILENVGSGSFVFDGGTARATGNQAAYFSGFEAGDVTIDSGGAFIDSNGFAIGINTVLSGTGGLTKLGLGTLSLSGSNSYLGGTTVTSGTLAVLSNTGLGSGTVTVDNTLGSGATLRIAASVGNAITLTEGAALINSGTITRSGANQTGVRSTASGAPTVVQNLSGAKIESVDSHGILLQNGGTVQNTSAVIVGGQNGVYIANAAGAVSNESGASITGTAHGVHLQRGGSVLNTSSTIRGLGIDGVVGGSAVGSTTTIQNLSGGYISGLRYGVYLPLSGTLVNSAGSVIAGSSGTAVVGVGAAVSVTNSGSILGSVELGNHANAATLNVGSLINGNLNLGNSSAASLTLGGTGSQAYSAAVTGSTSFSGSLTKQDAGTWTLDRNLLGVASTQVSGGTLRVSGTLGGSATVGNGATVSGTGKILGAVTVQNGGILAPGNSAGTLTLADTAAFESGSLFSLEGDGALFDRLDVAGAVTITSGALISFSLLNPLTEASYTLMTAASGLDGSVVFTLSGALPTDYILQYNGTSLDLVLASPVIGSITATPSDTVIITGGTTSVVVTVENDGPNGGQDLDATVTGDGTNLTGSGSATVAPGATGTASPDLAFTSTAIGVQTGTVTVTDPVATNSPQTGTMSLTVLDHADPILTVSGGNSQSVIVGATGITATLNLANGSNGETDLSPMDVGNLSTGLSGTTGSGVIGSGASANYTASLNTGTVGASQNQVFGLEAGDQQSLPGANALGTYSATVALNVYGHAAPSLSGTTLNLGYVHEGYAAPIVSNTQLVTNGTAGAYIVDLKASGTGSGNISINGISGVASGSSATIAATLATGQGVGVISGTYGYVFADDSSLAGASSNVGSTTFVVAGEVYSGQGVWITNGSGSWGTPSSGFGVNWQAGGGSPGLDAAFASTDTATFGSAGSGIVTLDGAAPSLKAITFDNATNSYAILQGTGGTLTLNGGTNAAVIENLNGNHFIGTPINLATNTLFTVANTADRLTINGPISGSGNVEVTGSGRTVFTQNQSYTGTTTVTSGVLASRNLTGGAVNLNGGLFSPGDEGTISAITVSTLNLNGGGLEFDLATPGASDAILVTGTTTLNAATQFTFLDAGFEEGVFALVQSGTLSNFTNAALSGLTFVSDIDGLQGLFGVANNTLYFRGFTEDTIFTGPVLSNYAPYLIPTTGKFLVDGAVTTWPEDRSNTIDSLIFKNGGSLFVFNDLTVTSGDFTVRRGSASIEGGRVVVPGDFNLIGRGTLYAGSEFAIGGDANINGGNLVIDGLFNAGGDMNVHSTVTVNGNAQIGGNLNTDASEIIVNGIFGIGKSANLNNGSFLLVNQSGVMNVAQATNIHAGSSAQINGLLTSPQVNVSGLLKGTGVIAGNVVNNGIVAPGNSPGVLTVNGNYVQTANGALQIEFGDLLFVSGNASLAGRLQLLGGRNLKYGQQITFLQAGSISGEFDEVVVPNPSKNRGRVLTEGGTGTLLIAPTSYTLVAETTNQQNVAKALDSFIPAKANDREVVSIALDLQSEGQYPAAFDQIAPTYYEALGNITIEQAFVQSQQLNQRLSAVRLGARGFQAIGIESPLKHDKDGKSAFEAKDAKKSVEEETATNWNIWAMGNGQFARVTSIGQLPNYSFNSGGFLVGGDYRWSENFVTGLYGGYQYTWADAGDNGNTQINSALFGGYASYTSGGFYADGIVGGGYNGYRVRRGITFSTIDRTARSQPNGGQMNASLNLGYDWEIGKFTLGPIAGVQYAYAGIAPFSETGADSLDLRVAQQNVNSLRTTFGGRVAYTWNVTEKVAIIPEVRMFWQHEFLNNPRNISSALDGGSGPTFGYETIAPARDSVFAGAGVSAQFGERWNAFLYWNVDFGRQNYFGNSVSGGLNWKF